MKTDLLDKTLFLPTALAALAFMFQTRHHNLYEHEKSLLKAANALKTDTRDKQEKEDDLELLNHEIWFTRRRYFSAWFAFLSLMLSVALLIAGHLTHLSNLIGCVSCLLNLSLTCLAISFFCHLAGDLGLAVASQLVFRRRTDTILNELEGRGRQKP